MRLVKNLLLLNSFTNRTSINQLESGNSKMSNIWDVLNPPKSRDLTEEELKDCLPCQLMASFTGIAGGLYLSSGKIFANEKPGDNPQWWKKSVRTTGVFMIGFGIYRAGQGWLWDKDHEYKKW